MLALAGASSPAAASDQILFPATDNGINALVDRIKAETVRVDISAWYLTEHLITQAIEDRINHGVPVRLIGDRVAIFESDPHTKTEFYYLANIGVPIRLRFNPTWYPEINHWKMAIFVGQGVAEFGSANWTTVRAGAVHDDQLRRRDDAVHRRSGRSSARSRRSSTRCGTTRPTSRESIMARPPYLKNWNDACANEPTGTCDFFQQFPGAKAPDTINTARLEPDNPLPADLIWGQGPDFNNRLSAEINNEQSSLQFVIYRLTVDNITNALLSRWAAGVQMQLLIEPNEYANPRWPEYWITHANIDKLWAAGIPIKQRVHVGLTHMKTLVTSTYATNASSNYAAGWQRDHDYFVSATGKPSIYSAIKDRVTAMWNDPSAFQTFQPQPPNAPALASPGSGATGVATNAPLVWNLAPFATDFDVYLGTSSRNLSKIGNVRAQLVNNPPSTYSLTPSTQLCPGTTYVWKVVSRTNATPVNGSMIASSDMWSFTTAGVNNGCTGGGTGGGGGGGGGGGTSNVPAPWATQDVGAVGIAGSANFANGTFTVNAAGSDIWGNSDSFRYTYQPLSGDGQIVARVTSEQNTSSFAKAGVMLRESANAGAAHVMLDVKPDGSIEFMTRLTTNGATSFIAASSQPFPAWLKLARSGNTVTGYRSSDGSNWIAVGSTSVTMSTSASIGLAVTSHDTSALNTSMFDNVAVTSGGGGGGGGTSNVPAPWATQDVGAVGIAGSANFANGTFTVNAAGSDIWGNSDSFRYTYQPLSGDGQIVARVTSEQNTSSFAKAGVMLRESANAGAAHVVLDVKPDGSIEFMTRLTTNGATSFIAASSQPFPAWLETGPQRQHGDRLPLVGRLELDRRRQYERDDEHQRVDWAGRDQPRHVSAQHVDIRQRRGHFGRRGWRWWWWRRFLAAEPMDESGRRKRRRRRQRVGDEWNLHCQGCRGRHLGLCRLVPVRLAGAQWRRTNRCPRHVRAEHESFAKGGVMLRETTSAGSAHVVLDLKPDGSVEFMTRATTNGATSFIAASSQPFPAWLKLARSGNTVTGYRSSDGSNWIAVGSTSVTMSTNALIGLAVTSHNTSALNTSTFDNVSVTAGGAPPALPPTSTNVVIYASDIPSGSRHGSSWTTAADGGSPNGVKLVTPDAGAPATSNPQSGPPA